MLLIMMAFIIGMAATGYFLATVNSHDLIARRDELTSQALVEAKLALIGWSVKSSLPGQLPCPENISLISTPNEGTSMTSCNAATQRIGRLPWRTLGIGDIRDGNGDKLWYVVSDGFRAPPINTSSPALLGVDAMPNSALAIIFSPGTPLQNQDRTLKTDYTQFLDEENKNGDLVFQSTGNRNVFNDRLMVVTKKDLFTVVVNRVLGEIRGDSTQGLVRYYTNADPKIYPYADGDGNGDADSSVYAGYPSYVGGVGNLEFPSNKTMLVNNGWFPLIQYELQADGQLVRLSLNGKTMVVAP